MGKLDGSTLVLCVPTGHFEDTVPPGPSKGRDGFLPSEGGWGSDRRLRELMRVAVWLPRTAELETDERWKQLVAYVLLRNGRKWFWYWRPGSGGDARLWRRLSLGLGGHAEAALDDPGTGPLPRSHPDDPFAVLARCAYRELEEEVAVPAAGVSRLKLRGLLNDDSDPVGRVHLGLVYEAVSSVAPRPGGEVAGWGWRPAPAPDLTGGLHRTMVGAGWESWSALVAGKLARWADEGAPAAGPARVVP